MNQPKYIYTDHYNRLRHAEEQMPQGMSNRFTRTLSPIRGRKNYTQEEVKDVLENKNYEPRSNRNNR